MPLSKSATTQAMPGTARLTSATGLRSATARRSSSGNRDALSTNPSTARASRRTIAPSWAAFSWVSPSISVSPAAAAARSAPLMMPAK